MGSGGREVPSFDVAIVGGGAAGTLVATRLLANADSRLRVAIVEPAAELARGAAYSTEFPEHLLNVIAARMSSFEEDPGHFVRFLAGKDDSGGHMATLGASFAPRRDYGRYLRETLRSQPRYPSLQHLRDHAVDIDRENSITLRSGGSIRARAVVLAAGNAARGLPPSLATGGACIANAWDHTAIQRIEPDADVCILGSGLSMVDAVVTLARRRHRGRIRVLSRHGLMPLPHAAPGPRDRNVDDLLGLGLRDRLRALRERVRTAVAAGEPWQWTFDRLRPHGQAMWRSLHVREQARFLRHLARYWDIHRHRIAPEIAATLDGLRAGGQMEIVAGRVSSVDARSGAAAIVHYRRRHCTRMQAFQAHWIVNATGIESDVERRPDALMHALRMRGRILPGPHGLGIASEGIGFVLDAGGRPDPNLLVLGALRIGDLWESIAVPELRGQAYAIAGFLQASSGVRFDY